MKRIGLLLIAALFVSTASSQVFKTGQTLKPKTFSIGIEPAVIINGNADFILFLHGGYGITKGIDIGAKVGVLGGNNYFGADIEFALGRQMSISFGAHDFGSFGLDGTFLATFPIRGDVRVYAGADLDINFPGNDVNFPLWVPVGVEVGIRKSMSFIFEASVGLTQPAYHLIGGGVNFYL
ncbi:MAG: hypothetical protein ACLFNU_05380 [Bacteroidales bacterium]